MKQIGLLAAGCQPWNTDVCAASRDRFAYCATLAIYIYQLERPSGQFKLMAIMSEHKKTITGIAWHPKDDNIFASAGADHRLFVWNVTEQKVIAMIEQTKLHPSSVGWSMYDKDVLTFSHSKGSIFLWNYLSGGVVHPHKEAHGFVSDISMFRWHKQKHSKLVVGHVDGSLSFFCPGQRCYKHTLKPDVGEGSDEEDPVVALEWDPLSVDYLLVANQSYGVRMIDSDSRNTITTFVLPSTAASIRTLAWVPTAPGMFITGDSNSGVLRLWNVSKPTPIMSLKLKKTGFHALAIFSTSQEHNNNSTNAALHALKEISSTSNAMSGPSSSTMIDTSYALPPGHAVCCFLDGGVGLYDLGKRSWDFLRELGHVETIFDCKFKPDNPDQIATASFDGTVKVWDVNTLSAVNTSPGNEGVIYAISWAPADLNCIVAGTSKHGAFIWDMVKSKIIKRFTEHGKASIYSVAWNHKDSKRIASCGADHFCIIREVDGNLIQRYKHPSSVFGCDWSPNNKDMIATGCEDGNVRVYYIATATDHPLKVFSGHSAKVFHVKWSPLRDGILCSGSDDGTIRIWDYTQDSCVSILVGHAAPVRGLLWNPEIPYILISGSWDYTIRVWDTRDGACVDKILDHGADVYGLTAHPNRPFVLASCARDSTLRIWSLTPLITGLQMKTIAMRPLDDVISGTEHAMAMGVCPHMAGKASKDLKQRVEHFRGNVDPNLVLKWFSDLFSSPGGTKNLWELAFVVNGQDDSLLPDDYRQGIMHSKHLVKFTASAAQELEMAKVSRYGSVGGGTRAREERLLREAANLHIKLGQMQRYCELMVQVGEWEKALAVAPSVSMEYWKSLTARRAEQLVVEDSSDCVPYFVALGNVTKLVSFYSSHNQLEDAMLVSQVACEGGIQNSHCVMTDSAHRGKYIPTEDHNGVDEPSKDYIRMLHESSASLADRFFQDGAPVMAACCHLAVGNVQLALSKLIRGHELELAVCIGKVLKGNKHQPLITMATELLARRCESLENWDLAVDILKTIPSCEKMLVKVCARCRGGQAEINASLERAGLLSIEDYNAKVEDLGDSEDDLLKRVEYCLLSSHQEKALEIGLKELKSIISKPDWTVNDVCDILCLLSCVRTEKLQQQKFTVQRGELLIISAYVGALLAIKQQYNGIVAPLFHHTRSLLNDYPEAQLPITEHQVLSELDAWLTMNKNAAILVSDIETKAEPSADQSDLYQAVLRRTGEQTSSLEMGADFATGSHLPSHSDVHRSLLTGKRIQGPAFFLEDGTSAISLNDALMWAKVNPFSPLGHGNLINPF
ncbi:WD repeat-containing protein 17-like [Amphiura filiformis]|uniref:WD repeat-containing protein 17-like n=1 Tax=Amphiura filiformis TaxID=82378 RepID=UPI003B21D851